MIENSKILILGSTGLLGNALVDMCKDKKLDHVGLSHKDIDITEDDLESELLCYNPNIIINATMIGGPRQCEENPVLTYKVNTIAVYKLAKLCEKYNITFVQIGTHNIFDGTKDGFYTENDIPNPLHLYGTAKVAAESLIKNICKKYYILRTSVLFGDRKNKRLSIHDKIFIWIDNKKDLYMADNMTDTFSYNVDVAEEIIRIITSKKPYGIYHVCNSGKTTYYDFAKRIIEKTRSDVKIFPVDGSKQSNFLRPMKLSLSTVKLSPLRSWKESLDEYIRKREDDS